MNSAVTRSFEATCLGIAMLLCLSCSDSARGQSAVDSESITKLITQLDDAKFRTRQQAGRQLESIGQPAVESLEAVQKSGSPEQRLRAAQILERILRDSFAGRLRQLQSTLAVADAQRLAVVVSILKDRRQ